MSDMPEAKVYTDYNIGFVADQVAEIDAVQRFIIAAAKASETFEDFKKRLEDELKEVKITQVINIEDWIKEQKVGFIVVMRSNGGTFDGREIDPGPIDYLRDDDDGLPLVFLSRSQAMGSVPEGYELIRVLDLSEQHEK